jgi:hypothetical protein
MAIDLTVSLTDAEQAAIEQVAHVVAPGASPAIVKQWAETKAKEGLRQAVVDIYGRRLRSESQAQVNADVTAVADTFPASTQDDGTVPVDDGTP